MSVDYPDYATPQANATAISITGAPLLNMHGSAGTQNTIIGPGITSVQDFTVIQPGWTLNIQVEHPSTATLPVARLRMDWLDLSAGVVVDSQEWFLACGNFSAGGLNGYLGRGPTAGNVLKLSLQNMDGAQNLTFNYDLFQDSVPRERAYLRFCDDFTFSMPGETACDSFDVGAGLLGQRQNGALAVAGTDTRIFPPWKGKAQLFASTGSGTSDLTVLISALLEPAGMTYKGIYQDRSNAQGQLNAVVTLPGTVCTVTMTNGAASAKSCDWALIAQDY